MQRGEGERGGEIVRERGREIGQENKLKWEREKRIVENNRKHQNQQILILKTAVSREEKKKKYHKRKVI